MRYGNLTLHLKRLIQRPLRYNLTLTKTIAMNPEVTNAPGILRSRRWWKKVTSLCSLCDLPAIPRYDWPALSGCDWSVIPEMGAEQLPSSPFHWWPLQDKNQISPVLLHLTVAVDSSWRTWSSSVDPPARGDGSLSVGHPIATTSNDTALLEHARWKL